MKVATKKSYQILSSEVLGEPITLLINLDDVEGALRTRNLLYRLSEIELLEALSPDDDTLRAIHAIKKKFKGWIVADCDEDRTKGKPKSAEPQTFAHKYRNKRDHAAWVDKTYET